MERDGRDYNRGSGGAARGRSGDDSGNHGCRGGNYPHQQYGGGGAAGAGAGGGGGGNGRGWGPSQQGQNQGQGGVGAAGGGGGRGGARPWGPSQQGQNQGGAAGGGGGRGVVRGWGPPQTGDQQWVDRPIGGGGAAYRLPPPQGQGVGAGPTSGVWSGRTWSASTGQSFQTQFQPPPAQRVPEQALPVKFNPESIIMHYDVDIKPNVPPDSRAAKRPISKSDLCLVVDKLFSNDPTRFPDQISAYDGEKNIFSTVPLPTGIFNVELSSGENTPSLSYTFSIPLVNNLKLSKLNDYPRGMLSHIPHDILQAMDLVMKENPKGLPIIDFLMEYFQVNDVRLFRRELKGDVMYALKALKVYVTHRVTHEKYVIEWLTDQNAQDLTFTLEDREGENPSREIGLVEYFREKDNKEIIYQDMPCLDLGKGNRKNYVPMEFCVNMVDEQTFPKEQLKQLDDETLAVELKKLSLVRSKGGPCGGEEFNSSPPCDAIFKYLIPTLVALLALKYNGKTENPFETHPPNMWTFVIAICIYCLALGFLKEMKITCEIYPRILSYVTIVSGAVSCVSLVSIFLPHLLGRLVLWAFLAIILVGILFKLVIVSCIGQRIVNAIDWTRDKFNNSSQRIANSIC